MTLTTIIAINAVLDLAVVLALAAIVHLAHRWHHDATRPKTARSSGRLPAHAALSSNEAERLAEAA